MDHDDWFTLAELSARLGGLVWVEQNISQVLQTWASADNHAGSAVLFATASAHHRWHSEVVRECLPTSPQLTSDDVVRAPTTGWLTAIETLTNLAHPDSTAARLRSLAKVVDPWLDREIGVLRELSRPVSDAVMMRWLRFVVLDHHDDAEAATLLTAAVAEAPTRFDDHVLVNSLDLGS